MMIWFKRTSYRNRLTWPVSTAFSTELKGLLFNLFPFPTWQHYNLISFHWKWFGSVRCWVQHQSYLWVKFLFGFVHLRLSPPPPHHLVTLLRHTSRASSNTVHKYLFGSNNISSLTSSEFIPLWPGYVGKNQNYLCFKCDEEEHKIHYV